jgi:hypothetical protein
VGCRRFPNDSKMPRLVLEIGPVSSRKAGGVPGLAATGLTGLDPSTGVHRRWRLAATHGAARCAQTTQMRGCVPTSSAVGAGHFRCLRAVRAFPSTDSQHSARGLCPYIRMDDAQDPGTLRLQHLRTSVPQNLAPDIVLGGRHGQQQQRPRVDPPHRAEKPWPPLWRSSSPVQSARCPQGSEKPATDAPQYDLMRP